MSQFAPDDPNNTSEDTSARWDPLSDTDWAIETGDFSGLDTPDTTPDANPAPAASSAPAAGTVPVAGGVPDRTQVQPQIPQTIRRQTLAAQPSQPYDDPYMPAQDNPYIRQASPQTPFNRRRASAMRASQPAQPYESPNPASSYRPRRARWAGPRHGCLSSLLWLVLLGCAALLGLRCLPASVASGRLVPELVGFVPLTIPALLICVVLACLWRRIFLAVLSICALVVTLSWHWGYFVPTARVSSSAQQAVTAASVDDSAARIMTLNTYNGSADAAQIVQMVANNHVEVLCLEELTTDFIDKLEAAGIDQYLPYHTVGDVASQISNGGRNGIWTAAAQSNISTNLLPISTSSMPAVDIVVGGQTVRIVAVHPNSPVRGAEDEWAAGLKVIQSLADYNHAYILMGDFNSTWDHARFRELLGTTFVDASEQSGQLFHFTFPSNSSIPSLLEIDHIVYTKNAGVVVSDLSALEVSGSDHRALLGTLETGV